MSLAHLIIAHHVLNGGVRREVEVDIVRRDERQSFPYRFVQWLASIMGAEPITKED